MLRASGETIEGPRHCDWFDVFVDDQSNLVVLLMDVRSGDASDSFVASLVKTTRAALQRHERLHAVVNDLEMLLAAQPGAEAGLIVLRVAQREARVEVLNAGMPAIASATPGARIDLFPSLSGPIGRRVGEVHPYELVPLVWGGSWLAASDGMLNGSLDPDNVTALCAKLDLPEQGLSLATATPDELYDAFQVVLPAVRFLRDDATAVVVSTDPGARFQSGIV
jgi:hypothetical protein